MSMPMMASEAMERRSGKCSYSSAKTAVVYSSKRSMLRIRGSLADGGVSGEGWRDRGRDLLDVLRPHGRRGRAGVSGPAEPRLGGTGSPLACGDTWDTAGG